MKRMNLYLSVVLALVVGLFGVYLVWIHNNLDTEAPVFTIEEGILEISVEDPEEALLRGVTAVDARDGDVTGSVLVERISGITADHLTTVTYAAFDRSGNVSKVQRQVRYTDYESPKFVLNGSLSFAKGTNVDVMTLVGAYDVIEGDISRRVHGTLVSQTSSLNEIGTHTVRFQVTNSLGDTAELELPVEVYDPLWYTATVELEQYMVYLDRGAQFDARSYLDKFLVRGDEIDVPYYVPFDIECQITDNVDTDVPGVYEVSYVLTKDINLTTYSGFAKLIVVVGE